jgi:uncharacterized protein (TIGR00369 family)
MSEVEINAGTPLAHVPHAQAIGMTLVSASDGVAVCTVPYDDHLVGNPLTGVVHGGVVTTLLDNACGVAVGSKMRSMAMIATLDLRIDYLKPAEPGLPLFARAECYKLTRSIAFVRGTAHQGDEADPVATCAAAFVITNPKDFARPA